MKNMNKLICIRLWEGLSILE